MRALLVDEYPPASLLARYRERGAWTDCYVVRLERSVSLAEFVTAFYTTPLFRLERFVLRWLVSRPSTDEQVRQLALGQGDHFAAWQVEARAERQVLLVDLTGATRSWLMAESSDDAQQGGSSLYFGSAILKQATARDAEAKLAPGFRLLLPLHRIYSKALLWSARRRLDA